MSRNPIALALAALLAPAVAAACPCNLTAGPQAPITQPGERYGLSLGLSLFHELGSFNARGRFTPDPAGVRSDRAALDLGLAWRPATRWELGLAVATSIGALDLPGVRVRDLALGDTVLRARFEPRSPVESSPWPGVGLTASVRVPTATTAVNGASVANASGMGLGAWELSTAVDLRENVGERFQAVLAGEFGWRVATGDGGNRPTPGVRVSASATGVYLPSWRVAVAVGVGLWWEAPSSLAGRVFEGAGFYRVTATAGATVRLSESLRCAIGLAIDPPLTGMAENTVSSARGSLSLAWAR